MTGWKGPALSAPVTLWLLLAFAAPLAVVILLSLQAGGDPFAPLIQPLSLAQFVEMFIDASALAFEEARDGIGKCRVGQPVQ